MGLGSWLKHATTIPSHGILSPLRKVFGETPLDEIGAVGGMLVGGPAGAAAGAGLGSFVHNQNLGDAAGNAAKFGAAGLGAAALPGLIGGGGAAAGAAGEGGGLGSLFGSGGLTGINLSGLLGDALKTAAKNPNLVLGGIGMLENAKASGQAANLRNTAVDMASQQYNDMAPVRQAAAQRLASMPTFDPTMFLPKGGAYDASPAPTAVSSAAPIRPSAGQPTWLRGAIGAVNPSTLQPRY